MLRRSFVAAAALLSLLGSSLTWAQAQKPEGPVRAGRTWRAVHEGMSIGRGAELGQALASPTGDALEVATISWDRPERHVLLYTEQVNAADHRRPEAVSYWVRASVADCAGPEASKGLDCERLSRKSHVALRVGTSWYVASRGYEPQSGRGAGCKAGTDCVDGPDPVRWELAELELASATFWPAAIDVATGKAGEPDQTKELALPEGEITGLGIYLPDTHGRHIQTYGEAIPSRAVITPCVFGYPATTRCWFDDTHPDRKLRLVFSEVLGASKRSFEFRDATHLICGTLDTYTESTFKGITTVTFRAELPGLVLAGSAISRPGFSTMSGSLTLGTPPSAEVLFIRDLNVLDDPPCCPVIEIQPATLANGTAGVAYAPVTFTQNGGALPVSWSATGLPAGMSLSAGGVLSGTPTVVGSFIVSVVVTDAEGCSSGRDVPLTIVCPTINITPTSLLNGTAGVAYGPVTFTQTGGLGAITWDLSTGALPAGLSLSAGGVLSGTPTVVGTFNFTVRATDVNGCIGTRALTLTVVCPTITILPVSLTNGTAGVAYGPVNFTQTNGLGAITWSISGGALPAGLTLSAAGVLSGTPTVVGTFSFTVRATDVNACFGDQPLTLTIVCPTINVTPTSLSNGTAGVAYPAVNFAQTGGVGTITWSLFAGPLPTGMTLTPAGVLSGTPTQTGTFNLTVRATDQNGCTGDRVLTLTVVCPTINVTPTSLSNGTAGVAYPAVNFAQTGGVGTITWSLFAGALPTGMTLTGAGVLSGTPTQTGTFNLTVRATDQNNCTGDRVLTLMIVCPTINVTPTSLANGTAGVGYGPVNFAQTGGVGTITWSLAAGTLPTGMSLTGAGVLSGTPLQTGTFNITVRATDQNNCTGNRSLTLTILCPTIVVSPLSLANGLEGSAYGPVNFGQTGGVGTVTWSLSGGALPGGITFTAGGVLSGTPNGGTAGSYTATFTATDQNGCTGSRTLTFRICPVISPTITPTSLPVAIPNVAYGPFTFNQTGSAATPITWSHTGTLPTGFTFTSAGVLSGTTTAPGTFPVTFIATDANGCTGSVAITIQTCLPITVTNPGNSNGTAGSPFSATFTQAGAVSPTFTLNSGTLPTGLTLATNGVLSGTPLQTGSFPITVLVTDSNGCPGTSATYTLVIACQTINVSNPATTTGTAGAAFSQTFNQTGAIGGTTYTLFSGTLPAGLTLAANGTLSGTPTQTGSFPIVVRVTDSNGCTGTGATYNLVINCQTITVTNPATTTGTVNAAFSQTFTQSSAIGGATFTTASTLPAGLSLATNGVLSGTPTQTGTFPIVVTVTDGNGCTGTSATYTLVISCQTISITNPATTTGTVSSPFSQTFTQTGAVGTATFTTASTLPVGLSLSTGGVLSGTPTQNGTFPIVVTVTDSNGCTGTSATYTLVINCQTITVTPASIPNGVAGVAYTTQNFGQTGGLGTVTYSLFAGTLPTGLTLTGAGVLSGTPTQTGTFNITVRATDQNGCTGDRVLSFTINCNTVTVTAPASLANGTVGTAYGPVNFSRTGTVGTVTWTSSPALPNGLTFTTAGVLSGTPLAGSEGSYTITFTVTDQNACTGNATFTFRICPSITPTITPTTLPNAIPNVAFGPFNFAQTGSTATPITWSHTGTLPTGITFTSAGVLSGTTPDLGSFPVTFIATDANGCTGSVTINVQTCPTITVNPATLPNGTTTVAYNQTITATGGTGPYTFAVTAGALPTSLTLASGGGLTGTPTVAGSYTFTVTATDTATGCTASRSYTVVICNTVTVNPATLPNGLAGTPYSQTVSHTGGTGTTTFAVTAGSLPTSLSLDGSTGAITGTPSAAGLFNFTITATDSLGCTGSRAYSVRICPVITLTAPPLPDGTVGTGYSQSIVASGGTPGYTYAITAGTQPTSLTLSGAGVLSGTPSASGNFTFTVTATDANGCTGSQSYTVRICAAITVNPATLPNGNLTVAYNQTVTSTGGNGAVTYAVTAGALPTGLSLASGGAITGTPTASGSFTFTVTATDSIGCTGSRAYTVQICDVITLAAIPTCGVVGTAYSGTATASPAGTYTYAVTAGALPGGLTLTPGTGAISGNPTTAGSFNFTITATQAVTLCTGSQAYTVSVLNMTPAAGALTDGTFGTAYSQTFTASGGTGGFTYATASTLPGGLSLSAAGVLSGTPTGATGTGSFSITVVATNTATGCTVSKTYTLNVRPVAVGNTYADGAGNTEYYAGGFTPTPATPFVSSATNILTNDLGPSLTAAIVTQPANGTVTLNSDGSFRFNPTAPANTSASFTYNVTSNGVTSATAATVTITLVGEVWYVNGAAGAGIGTSNSPFNTIGAADTASGVNDVVYVHAGAPTGNISLANGQVLWGAGTTFSLAGSGLVIAATSKPILSGTVTATASNVTVSSLDITTSAGAGFTSTSSTGLVVTNGVAISATNFPALNLQNGTTVNVVFSSLSSTNSASTGINIQNTTGIISAAAGAISNATNTDVNISGGGPTFTYAGTITDDTGAVVQIASTTGGSMTFTGAISDGFDGDGNGISLQTNTGATITFAGGLELSTGGNAALTITGGGTVNICDENPCNPAATGALVNRLATTTGTALNVANTTIGANNLEFRSISSAGAASGIILNATGSTGGLKVKGSGSAGSGGTISGSTGPGISLSSTSKVGLAFMNVQSGTDDGINGANVTDFVMSDSSVTNNGNSTTDEGIEFDNLLGTCSMTNVTATGNAHNNLYIDNSSGTLTSLAITGGSYSNTAGNHGILFEARLTAIVTNVTISGATISNNFSIGVQVTANDTSTASFTISGNTFSGIGANTQEIAIDCAKAHTSNLTCNILNNAISNHNSHGLNVFTGAGAGTGGTLNATITGNTIGLPGTPDSGSRIGNGMRLNVNGDSPARILVDGNFLHQIATGRGIEAIGRNGTGGASFIITNNTITAPTSTASTGCGVGVLCPLAPVFVQSNCVTVCNTVCAKVSGNTAYDPASVGLGAEASVTLAETGASTLNYEGNVMLTALQNLTNANPGAATRSVTGAVAVVGSACPAP